MDPEEPEPPFRIRDRVRNQILMPHQRDQARNEQRPREEPLRPVFHIGGSIIQATAPDIITSDPSGQAQQEIPIAANKSSQTLKEDLHGNQASNIKRAIGPGMLPSKREDDLKNSANVLERADIT